MSGKFCSDSHHFDLKSQTLEIFRAGTNPGWVEHHGEEVDELGHWPEGKTEFRTCKICETTLGFDVLGFALYVPEEKNAVKDRLADFTSAFAQLPGASSLLCASRTAAQGGGKSRDSEENCLRSITPLGWCSCH